MKVVTIILNWNGKHDTLRCLESVSKIQTPHHVIAVDNGSTDGSQQAIRENFPTAQLIETGKNLGYAEGNNIGIRAALNQGAEALLILNNDTVAEKTLLEGFLTRDLPIQGAHTRLMETPYLLDHLGGIWDHKKADFDLVGFDKKVEKYSAPTPLDYACGVALFVKREVFETIGLFDPRFFLFWEEADWCFRAKKKGYLIQSCPEAILYHKRSASFKGGRPHIAYFWWRNRLLFIEKNFSGAGKFKLKRRVLKEFRHFLKLYCLKASLTPFRKKTPRRTHELISYRSVVARVKDYHFRRFGNCPDWVVQ